MKINQQTDALLLIDVQPDFMPGGKLAVYRGDEVLAPINRLGRRFDHVVLTQDWHPPQHISFASVHGKQPFETIAAPYGEQTLWPEHCLQHSPGAALHPDLDLPHAELILRKGFRQHIDSYSAFLENDHRTPTGLAGYLRERGLERLFLAGLAYDFCVRFSAVDGKQCGFETFVVEDAARPVAIPAAGARKATVEEANEDFAAHAIPRLVSAEL